MLSNSLRRLKTLDQWWNNDFRVWKFDNIDKIMEKVEKMIENCSNIKIRDEDTVY